MISRRTRTSTTDLDWLPSSRKGRSNSGSWIQMSFTLTDLEAYLAHNYGSCALGARCGCLKTGWIECGCKSWVPCGAKDWDELWGIQEKIYGY